MEKSMVSIDEFSVHGKQEKLVSLKPRYIWFMVQVHEYLCTFWRLVIEAFQTKSRSVGQGDRGP